MYNQFHLQIPFLLYVLTFECFFKNNVQVTLWYKNMWVVEAWYVGNFGFRRVQSKFEGEIIKHHQNLDHGYVKHFQVLKKRKLVLFLENILLVGFIWNLFLVKLFRSISVPWPHQSINQTWSIRPCLIIGFLHLPKNLLILNHLLLKLWMTSMYILIILLLFHQTTLWLL